MAIAAMTTNLSDERFVTDAGRYAAYLETAEGRLRLDLAFANMQEFLPQPLSPLKVLDLGCGTGNLGLRYVRFGSDVTLLDASQAMLDLTELAAQEAGLEGRITLRQGDALRLSELFE